MGNGTERPVQDLLSEIASDHELIRRSFEDVRGAANSHDRADAFAALVRHLAAHEASEQEVVRPLTRRAPEGDRLADDLGREEHEVLEVLVAASDAGVDAGDFLTRLEGLEATVSAHFGREEREEHPVLAAVADHRQLQRLGELFRAADWLAPARLDAHRDRASHAAVDRPFDGLVDRLLHDAVDEAVDPHHRRG